MKAAAFRPIFLITSCYYHMSLFSILNVLPCYGIKVKCALFMNIKLILYMAGKQYQKWNFLKCMLKNILSDRYIEKKDIGMLVLR